METTLNLTADQTAAVKDGEPVRLSPAQIGEDVIVIRASAFAQLRELLEDEREKDAWAKLGLEAAAQWARENPY